MFKWSCFGLRRLLKTSSGFEKLPALLNDILAAEKKIISKNDLFFIGASKVFERKRSVFPCYTMNFLRLLLLFNAVEN